MVLSKPELIGGLQHEANILSHLTSKVEPEMVDYRPTEKQRSTLELLRYLTVMGPILIDAATTGEFDREAFGAAMEAANQKDFAQISQTIASLGETMTKKLEPLSEDDFRAEIEMFGRKITKGAFIVSMVLSGYAAYRTQLFCYLKSCGREELNTMNLWQGVDPEPAAG